MKVLMFSIDKNIFSDTTEVKARMLKYGSVVDELHILVFVKNQTFRPIQLAANVRAYPISVRWNIFSLAREAYKIVSGLTGRIQNDWIMTSQDAFTHWIGVYIGKKLGVPLEIQIHTDFMSPWFWRESIKNFIRYLLYVYAVRRADTIRVVSPRLTESLKIFEIPSERITTLPIFVDIKSISEARPSFDIRKRYAGGGQMPFVFMMASRLTREKNISLAIRAFSAVVRRYPANEIFLVIFGDGPERSRLQNLAKILSIEDKVKFEAAVDQATLVSSLKTADIFILTSNYEGYGRTLVEATAAKIPVITTDVGIARELFVHGVTGYIIPVGDENALERALLEAIKDYPRFKLFGYDAGAMLLDSPPSEGAYLRSMRAAWEKCLNIHKGVQ